VFHPTKFAARYADQLLLAGGSILLISYIMRFTTSWLDSYQSRLDIALILFLGLICLRNAIQDGEKRIWRIISFVAGILTIVGGIVLAKCENSSIREFSTLAVIIAITLGTLAFVLGKPRKAKE
jgi:hypothetical protein